MLSATRPPFLGNGINRYRRLHVHGQPSAILRHVGQGKISGAVRRTIRPGIKDLYRWARARIWPFRIGGNRFGQLVEARLCIGFGWSISIRLVLGGVLGRTAFNHIGRRRSRGCVESRSGALGRSARCGWVRKPLLHTNRILFRTPHFALVSAGRYRSVCEKVGHSPISKYRPKPMASGDWSEMFRIQGSPHQRIPAPYLAARSPSQAISGLVTHP